MVHHSACRAESSNRTEAIYYSVSRIKPRPAQNQATVRKPFIIPCPAQNRVPRRTKQPYGSHLLFRVPHKTASRAEPSNPYGSHSLFRVLLLSLPVRTKFF